MNTFNNCIQCLITINNAYGNIVTFYYLKEPRFFAGTSRTCPLSADHELLKGIEFCNTNMWNVFGN